MSNTVKPQDQSHAVEGSAANLERYEYALLVKYLQKEISLAENEYIESAIGPLQEMLPIINDTSFRSVLSNACKYQKHVINLNVP